MENLSEEVQLIISILEDARDEGDWDLVSKCIENLENVFAELDRQENGFQHDYD